MSTEGTSRSSSRGPRGLRHSGIIIYRTSYGDGHGAILGINSPDPCPHFLQTSGKPFTSWIEDSTQHDFVTALTQEDVRCTRLDLARDTASPRRAGDTPPRS